LINTTDFIPSSEGISEVELQLGSLSDFLPPVWNPDAYPSDLEHVSGENTPNYGTGCFTPTATKKLSLNPPCLHFGEVALLQSSIERIRAYVQKMQELSTYDTGLQDWVTYEKERREP
jgi:hypothetical protein